MASSFRAAGLAGRRLFALSARPERTVASKRPTLMRGLRLLGVSLLALYVAAVGVGVVAETLPWSPAMIVALALAQATPVILVIYRPIAAWWLSLLAALPYLILVGLSAEQVADEAFWPWSVAGIVAHLFVAVLVAYQVPPPVYLAQWLITAVVAVAAETIFTGRAQINNGLVLSGLYAVGLAGVAIARWLRDVRRELRHQVGLTERERSQRTVLEERTRIARELHDVVAHHMSVIAVQAEAAPYRVSALDPAATESFASIRQNALAALTETRQILGMLRSEQDSDNRYAPQPTLADLDQLFGNCRSAGLTLKTGIRGDVRDLPEQVELIAYRVIQEALSNVIRHAPGADVEVDVAYGPAELDLRVANSPSPAAGRLSPVVAAGHGLTGMRERAAVLGASLRAGRRDDGWYEVAMSLPVDRR
ncbi:sensor histidine kinase [Actinoplanes regularis]|uniref:histidine kinase n=1 Tax=Actinoplanes regularis TaxID=52697 RepID=A0A239ILW2_9ACTN|nr:histidine kinase [Actinoplanes regularis]GIE91432.1 two-component sensor histidine kinase [Actinoplanes regularis]SNS94660.1 Signal transduction histidine kinase [Actinoplanes regularis]